jgi:hypothetical protein
MTHKKVFVTLDECLADAGILHGSPTGIVRLMQGMRFMQIEFYVKQHYRLAWVNISADGDYRMATIPETMKLNY